MCWEDRWGLAAASGAGVDRGENPREEARYVCARVVFVSVGGVRALLP